MYLYCLTQENYPGLSKKTKDKLPWVKSKTTKSAARPPLLGWRCALVRILVFSFHLLSSSRRWLRWIDSEFLSEGCSVQARSVADLLLQSSLFLFKWGLRKIRSLQQQSSSSSSNRFILYSEDVCENSKSFHRVAKGEFNTNKTLLLKERLTQIKLFSIPR